MTALEALIQSVEAPHPRMNGGLSSGERLAASFYRECHETLTIGELGFTDANENSPVAPIIDAWYARTPATAFEAWRKRVESKASGETV